MAQTPPPDLTPFAGSPPPQRGDRATFSGRVDAFVMWLTAVVAQFIDLAANVYDNAVDAYNSAVSANTAAGGATGSATAAAASALTAGNAAATATSARDTAVAARGIAVTESELAQTAAESVLAHGALAGVPTIGPADAGKGIFVNDSGNGLVLKTATVPTVTYANRADLRTTDGDTAANPRQVLVPTLGLFAWESGSTEPDDDKTCFRTTNGAWLLRATALEQITDIVAVEIARLNSADRMLFGTATLVASSVTAGAVVSFTAVVSGAIPGDMVIATPLAQLGATVADQGRLAQTARVSAADTITITISNPSAASATLTPGSWKITVIKQ